MPGGDECILLVDDEDTIWDVFIEMLQKLGYSVILAENGQDAVEIYESNPHQIDLVVLDMVMPRMGGHEAFIKIKSIDPDARILISSSRVPEDRIADLVARGAKGFLPKPHGIRDLADAVRKAIDSK